ncbi:MAG: Fe-S cluster assembly protein SufD [Bacteroidales bacterium]|nr:Fe-S cluster assembly protein SufD [Bacteroidales bacterium]
MTPFQQFIQKEFGRLKAELPYHETTDALRERGLESFIQKDFAGYRKENRQVFDTLIAPSAEWKFQTQPPAYRPVEEYFHCKVQNIDTQMFVFLNGWYVHRKDALSVSEDGVITGSIFAALEKFPQLVLPYLTQPESHREDSLSALNRMMFNDGLFVYVPENVAVEKPVQLISLTDSNEQLMLHNRNLIVLGRNAQLSFIQCDDSIQFQKTFINNVTQVHLEEDARLSYYKMENKNPESLLFNEVEVVQKAHSQFFSNAMTFNTGYLRNKINVYLTEPFSSAHLYGLYLVDKKQQVDNQIYIDHQVPDCESYQLYKGIADDEAKAHFLGHVVVRPDAQRTVAAQTNRNITLTDQAQVTSKPFLEIYADDVKCNHGTTVGQLDDEAMFYLRTRGICERNARMLLMFAFANEIANHIKIHTLQERYKEMIRKRLNGELTICDQCVLHCPHIKDIGKDIVTA